MFAKQPPKDRATKGQLAATVTAQLTDQRKPRVASVIADDLLVAGDITSEGDLHVDGSIKGDVRVNSLTIGETGLIEGNIYADSVEARGRVIGSITAKVVRLFATAHVDGDVTHENLAMETGAFFQGRSQKYQHPPAATSEIIDLSPVIAG